MNKQPIYIALAIIVIGGFAGYIMYSDIAKEPIPAETVSEEEAPENIKITAGEDVLVPILGNNDKKEGGLSFNSTAQTPNLNRQIVIPDSIHFSQKDEVANKIAAIMGLLKQDTQSFNEWIELGLLLKTIEDYNGAREAWEYASVIRPQNSLSFGNLANLYGYYLQNPAFAEINYLQALKNDPKLPYLYMQTADFYLEVLKDPLKARQILENGLKAIPGDSALQAALEQHPMSAE